ncbi:MAG: 16S rRNA (cytosine(1402)-N(4))-methyltransferase RsmH [Spirochaetaceae bacterium]|jgi:16S rRNA (cytosine1402-N4)-methyltransferase|nr:16S rRNA (cytosine(1402)-N(4))-methyltransferase RsmH [Spirochaetaceae bacterium]
MEIVHTSVLLQETLRCLAPETVQPLMVDATLGEGGHSGAFLSEFPELRIIGVDADPRIQVRARERLAPFGERIYFYPGWADEFFLDYPCDWKSPDIILFDLGISLFHYERSGRGFSFRNEEPLDMRLNPHTGEPAEAIVNTLNEKDLADLIFQYGEERYSRRIARAITEARSGSRITTARTLADIIYHAVPQEYRRGGIHPATKTFQALRIAVNGELDRLPVMLKAALDVLAEGGKMGVITFHSLEDRIVKNFFRDEAKHCICPPEQPICICRGKPRVELLLKKPVSPSAEEVERNPPSRSARLRVVRKLPQDPAREKMNRDVV